MKGKVTRLRLVEGAATGVDLAGTSSLNVGSRILLPNVTMHKDVCHDGTLVSVGAPDKPWFPRHARRISSFLSPLGFG
jgi:hypothetical protein